MKLMRHHGDLPSPSVSRGLVLPAVSAGTLTIGALSLEVAAVGAVAVGALATNNPHSWPGSGSTYDGQGT
ncbi:hypothetical protein QMA10_00200 [Arthrobacter sp. APC 3897]|uniref:hypothetical protein n=1 Tax=Arthrobacter sp. APC 3897 TaxID=3035204 RepID=UPI0025B55AF5|nr:hypothetical protein [Arthrobacter sp. APC 3897]MDN3480348.1 hypothetical protein [Arthrobacter sp. APC 3897]